MPHIKQVVFNSVQDCFAIATDHGVRVFNSRPLMELANLRYEVVGSVKIVAILDRTNLMAIVSGEPRPKFSKKSVMIWDNVKEKFAVELTVNSPVLNVFVSSMRIVVVQENHIHVFSMNGFKLATHVDTGCNPLGLGALSPNPKNEYLVFPSFTPGSIQIVNLRNVSQSKSIAPATIYAHESSVVKIAIDNQATKVATGSKKGTIIRVFDIHSKTKLWDLRRGTQEAQLFCFRFSPDSSYLACSSDQGTIHVFSVTQKQDERSTNAKRIIDHVRFTKDERRSAFQFTMPNADQLAECAFLGEDASRSSLDLIAVTRDGYYYHFSELSSRPQGYELLFNLAHDQEFWKV